MTDPSSSASPTPEDEAPFGEATEAGDREAPVGDGSPATASESRQVVDALLRAHGAELWRYCVVMLGLEGAEALLPTILGHLQEHAGELGAGQERLVALAVAHNRCIERSRTGGEAPSGLGVAGEAARAMGAVARLRPVGRDALVLRSLLGLRWRELERVCGLPTEPMVMRTCRAWRNVMAVVDGGQLGTGRSKGRVLREDGAAWSAIREDARRFVALRQDLRAVLAGLEAPVGWHEEAWRRLDEERAEEAARAAKAEAARAEAARAEAARAEAARAEAARAEAARAEAAKRAAEAVTGPSGGATEAMTGPSGGATEAATRPSGGAFTGATDEDEAESPAQPRPRSWRWLAVGLVLALVGLAARWLVLR